MMLIVMTSLHLPLPPAVLASLKTAEKRFLVRDIAKNFWGITGYAEAKD